MNSDEIYWKITSRMYMAVWKNYRATKRMLGMEEEPNATVTEEDYAYETNTCFGQHHYYGRKETHS